MRRWIGAALATGVLTAVTGCTVETNGDTGISVDAAGRLVVVLAWCGPAPDGVTIYHDRTSPGPSGEPDMTDASYDAHALTGQTASFRPDAPSGGWTLTEGRFRLDPPITYHAYGWSRDNTHATTHVQFEAAAVAALQPGSVLVYSGTVVSQEEFDQKGQSPENCG
ncbi:hypothetical protein OG320_27410 [Microbispora sp. NBC_01189]|uniref:hypothetical protein n=1 Tax=Microbispora sp. NBC_01189 TaxID=2903583 RepID=UPI002E104180|nr:hypothetical protein OG320_27410 [Microbispora sp. NBC_01189]